MALLLNKAAGGSFNDLQLDGSDPKAQYWILDNQDVLGSLGGGGSDITLEEAPSSEPAVP